MENKGLRLSVCNGADPIISYAPQQWRTRNIVRFVAAQCKSANGQTKITKQPANGAEHGSVRRRKRQINLGRDFFLHGRANDNGSVRDTVLNQGDIADAV